MHQLSNGRYQVRITAAGGGQSLLDWMALSRWEDDPVEDARGFFIYLRDLDDHEVWSAGCQPVAGRPEKYGVSSADGRFVIERTDHGITSRMEVAVSAADDVEVRRVTLRNLTDRRRRIEVSSYIEVALGHPLGDLQHPAFSKLFVQTEWQETDQVLAAKRRPRSQGETWPALFHALSGADAGEWETDRLRFIGRGRSLAAPAALRKGASLSGTVGNVLDPVLSLRTMVELAPGADVALSFLLGAADDHARIRSILGRYRDPGVIEALFPPVALASVPWAALHPQPFRPRGGVALAGRKGNDPFSHRFREPADSEPPICGFSESVGMPSEDHAGFRCVECSGLVVPQEPLDFFNGIGGFNEDGSEYVMRLVWEGTALALPPMPWINVLANEHFGCLTSETGAGCTWSRNSQANRLTPWSNDPVIDPHGEAFFIRDDSTGIFWSPLPGPAPAPVPYETRHGFGCSRFASMSHGLEQSVEMFVARHDPVKIVRLRLTNRDTQARHLSLFGYQRLVLGSLPQAPSAIRTWRAGDVLCAENAHAGDFAGATVFAFAVVEGLPVSVQHVSCDRLAFLGQQGTLSSPQALSQPHLDGRCGEFDPCFARQLEVTLPPGQRLECSFVLGEAMGSGTLQELVTRYANAAAIAAALEEVTAFWRDSLGGVQVRAPSPEINLMVNGWLAYQALACRIWGRTAFYQSSGALGFRDQLQDAGNLSMLWPELTRRQILLHARHQFSEGDVMHWWHDEPVERGLRTRFSDDLLWLPFVVSRYVHSTGGAQVLDETASFLKAPELIAGQEENYLKPEVSGESASVYEHCCRAIDRSLACGAHGLPLMGTGDWNDGMNRVGRDGRGESVWLGFFLFQILGDFIPLARQRGDEARACRYTLCREALLKALNEAGWDGDWYRRAYYDDGTPLGTKSASECRIDGLAQSWAVLSGAAPQDRAEQAMAEVEARLVSEADGLIRLLTPPFVNTPEDPGYIKGYVAGVRENGGQYTHAACWVVAALAKLGHRDRAARLLAMLSPLWHTRTATQLETYKVEPYVIAADVYGADPHVGRGGWTWYTGSAGWAWRVAIESVLGLSIIHGDTLLLKPCVPDDWPGYGIDYRHPASGTHYRIQVSNPGGCAEAVVRASVEGRPCEVIEGAAHVAMQCDGGTHEVVVTLGRAGSS